MRYSPTRQGGRPTYLLFFEIRSYFLVKKRRGEKKGCDRVREIERERERQRDIKYLFDLWVFSTPSILSNATIGFFSFLRRPGASKSRGETERRGEGGKFAARRPETIFRVNQGPPAPDVSSRESRFDRGGGGGNEFLRGRKNRPRETRFLTRRGTKARTAFLPSFLPSSPALSRITIRRE